MSPKTEANAVRIEDASDRIASALELAADKIEAFVGIEEAPSEETPALNGRGKNKPVRV